MRKTFTVKIYALDGTYLKTLASGERGVVMNNDLAWTCKINGGQGELVLDLNYPLDDFDEGVTVDHMNVVKVYEADEVNAPTGRLVYAGFVSQYAPYVRGSREGVKLTCLGLVSLLALSKYKNGSNYSVVKTTVDPSAIATAIIDHFNTIYTAGWLGYAGGHATTVGTNISYTFVDMNWIDAMQECLDLSGGGRYWYIGADGDLFFTIKPTSATHHFTLGKNVDMVEIVKSTEKVVNQFQFRVTGSTGDYSDATSQTAYGVRDAVESDTNVSDATTRTQHGNKVIADSKDPKIRARVRVNANYDIESIKPGDTITVSNFKLGSSPFPTNLQITALAYSPDGVDLELEEVNATLAAQIKETIQKLA